MPRLLPTLPETARGEFLAAVRSMEGTRWVHKGRTDRGLDCIGLCIYGLEKIGVQVEDLADYSPKPDGVSLQAHVERHLGPPTKNWRPGDIVLMRWHESRQQGLVFCNHVGVLGLASYAPRWTLIHCHNETGRARGPENCVKEHSLDGHWPRRVYAVHSLTGAN